VYLQVLFYQWHQRGVPIPLSQHSRREARYQRKQLCQLIAHIRQSLRQPCRQKVPSHLHQLQLIRNLQCQRLLTLLLPLRRTQLRRLRLLEHLGLLPHIQLGHLGLQEALIQQDQLFLPIIIIILHLPLLRIQLCHLGPLEVHIQLVHLGPLEVPIQQDQLFQPIIILNLHLPLLGIQLCHLGLLEAHIQLGRLGPQQVPIQHIITM